jgi:hypothetical protein
MHGHVGQAANLCRAKFLMLSNCRVPWHWHAGEAANMCRVEFLMPANYMFSRHGHAGEAANMCRVEFLMPANCRFPWHGHDGGAANTVHHAIRGRQPGQLAGKSTCHLPAFGPPRYWCCLPRGPLPVAGVPISLQYAHIEDND